MITTSKVPFLLTPSTIEKAQVSVKKAQARHHDEEAVCLRMNEEGTKILQVRRLLHPLAVRPRDGNGGPLAGIVDMLEMLYVVK